MDGISSNLVGHFLFGTSELCNYTTMVGMVGADFFHVMNLDTWNSLPPDLQELIGGKKNSYRLAKASGYVCDLEAKKVEKLLDAQLKGRGYEGVYYLPEGERARWRQAAQPVWDKWLKKAAGLAGEAKAKAIMDDAVKFAEQYAYSGVDKEAEDILHEWGSPGF